MSTLTPKQEKIQQRNEQILSSARGMLQKGGYHGLNMDAIAAELKVAKGTVYNHYKCKEDIILALAVETTEIRWDMFQRAAMFRGTSRERLSAIGAAAELFVRRYPGHFQVEQILRNSSVWEKTSEERQSLLRSCETRCVGIVSGIVYDGIASSDLEMPKGTTPEDLVFALWSMTYGGFSIIATSESLREVGIQTPFEAIRNNINRLLDGYHWKPLSDSHDYELVRDRILAEVFPHEYQQLSA